MTPEETQSMQNALRRNHDIFAWAHADMKGIHPSITSHKLNVFSTARPVRQKIKRFHPDRQKVIRNEIDKLLEAGFIREVDYPDWLENVVVVPKKEGKWRVCVDYTNLNNACPKDSFPLPRIDQIVDSTAGFYGQPKRDRGQPGSSQGSHGNTSPRSKKELQRLTGKLVALGRFIARFTDELRPFFLTIRKAGANGWTDNCQNAFEKIKHCLMQPPILSSLIPKEKLYMYLAISEWAISAVLFRCPSPKEQRPIYYVSRALADVETRYSKMELTALALRSAAQKLRPYFQAHPVVVLTDQPLRNILHKPNLTGRMLQWDIELSEFGIEIQPRLSMKGQVMADFVLEYARRPNQHQESNEKEWWTCELMEPHDHQEYEAILSGLDLALALSVCKLRVYGDSQLVVRQVQKEYEAKDARMARYLTKVRDTLQRFTEWTIEKIRRTENGCADTLAGIATSLPIKEAILLPVHVQTNPSIVETSTCNTIEANQADGQEWTNGITEYLRTGTLPEDPKQAHKVGHSEAQYVLAELHEGICGNHSGGRSLAHRAHSQGYYWPTMKKDAVAYVKKCDKCQRYAPIPHMPSETLKPISGPWPFAQWGMDIVGPLPAAPAQKKFLLIATDYFSKWVEAKAYASIKDKDVTKFVWKNIVCRFGIPHTIIADNGPQFDSIAFRNFCSELNIRNSYSTPRYPQSNGQAEATNKTLITALKKRLEQVKGKWVEKLPASCGPIEPHPDDQQETLPSPSHMEWMQSFLPK
ncbi:Pro-Pol polyprotein [Vitis vinifera]|uniref:Pro-Pol polyprotein n=1 Tax=Vitis vinifera TaxID=29760 RepID=A0A438DUX9_VITVI|nr:Pro-Pol polyprotein [Vitis vinifera]